MKNSVFIIAEAGVNHNGDIHIAMKLIDAAVSAGADAVKFQTFKTENVVSQTAPKAQYQKEIGDPNESQFDMLSRLELSNSDHHRLVAHCKKLGIEFLSTAFDSESLNFLVHDLKLSRLKIASGELTNAPLVLESISCTELNNLSIKPADSINIPINIKSGTATRVLSVIIMLNWRVIR